LAKPAEVKKRARRLAQDGKIVDAIAALEELAQGDSTDPYDLVALGDLCVRGGRSEDATDYYERAVHAYRDAHLNRNAIALCRKVLRTHPDETRFQYLLAQMCEREGLTVDAVAGYMSYADTLSPEDPPQDLDWLDSLARLTPKSIDTLTRQSELLVRWGRQRQAVNLLRSGANMAGGQADRQALLDLARGLAEFEGMAGLTEAHPSSPAEGQPAAPESFDDAYLRDLDFGGGEQVPDSGIIDLDSELGVVEHIHNPDESTESTEPDESTTTEIDEEVPGLEMGSGASKGATLDDEPVEETLFDLDDVANSPEEVSFGEELESDFAENGSAPHELLAAEREALQASVQRDAQDVAALQKLLEVYLRTGDSVSATDLRERLAHALLMKGDSNGALTHYAAILSADPMRQDIRTRHDRLSSELGLSTDEPDTEPVVEPSTAKPGSLFNVKGLAKVEVKEDQAVSEDDMVDLGSLLDEFRAGLAEGMQGASPQAHYDLGLSHMEMDLYEEAIESFEKATAETRIAPEAREMWGRCLRKLERAEEAAQILRSGLAIRPDSLGIRYELARAIEMTGDKDEARKLYESITREDPNFEDAPTRLAALGDPDCPPQAKIA
jgi:tetratricopeptide (TPR) repeat protein